MSDFGHGGTARAYLFAYDAGSAVANLAVDRLYSLAVSSLGGAL